jgi:RNA polymerase sigma-70 factor, ECF subfamily
MSADYETTVLLAQWASGDAQALEELTRRLHKELRQIAASYMRKERPDHTLQPTALVNEAYIRLIDQKQILSYENRSHFMGIAARLMRQILVDHARRRRTGKRAGQKVAIDEAISLPDGATGDLLSLDSGLRALEELDPRKSRAVELHYFGGLTVNDIAVALNVSSKTVRRDLAMAEAWLYQRLRHESGV